MCFGDLCLKPKTWRGFQKLWRKAVMFQKNWCLKTTRHSCAIYSNTISLETSLWTKSSALPRSSRPSKLESWFLMISPPQKTTNLTLLPPFVIQERDDSKRHPKWSQSAKGIIAWVSWLFRLFPKKVGLEVPKSRDHTNHPGDSDAVAFLSPIIVVCLVIF